MRKIPLAVLVTALAAGCASSGLSSPDGWNVVRTKHLNLITVESERDYQPTLTAAEYSYASLSSSFFRNVKLDGPVDILLVSEEDFGGLLGYKRSGAVFASVPGGGAVGKNGLVVIKPDHDGNNSAEMLAHLFVQKMAPNAPLWFHEGFAAYVRNYDYKEGNGQRAACFGKPGGQPESYIPLTEVMTMSWDKYDDGPRTWFKHTSRTLVDYIMHAQRGKYLAKMPELIDGFGSQSDSGALLTAALEMPLDTLNTKVVEHGNEVGHSAGSGAKVRGLCPLPFPITDENAPDTGPYKVEPVPAADMEKLLAGIRSLPRLDGGYVAWYPPDVVAKAKK